MNTIKNFNPADLNIAVAGGGLVGLTVGIALKRLGARVTVYEQAPEIRAAGASIGLWKNALEVLQEIGLDHAIQTIATPLEAWFYDAAGNKFRAEGYGREEHSFLLFPRPQLNSILAEAMGHENILLDNRIIGYEEHNDNISIRLEDGRTATADLLIGADGVYSKVRKQLLPGFEAQEHKGHHVWRALVPTEDEPKGGSVLTVGHARTRGGYFVTYGNMTTWMINQFDSETPTENKKEEALKRAANMNDDHFGDELIKIIKRTPEESILHNQIIYIPALPRLVSGRVALIGDAAHGLSPHIAAGGTLGIEDVKTLINKLTSSSSLSEALNQYEQNRLPHYETVRQYADKVELAKDAKSYSQAYAAFSHWMLNEGYKQSRS